MSGRSAYVRKEKTKVKEGDHPPHEQERPKRHADPLIESFPMPAGDYRHEFDHGPVRRETKSVRSNGSDDTAYARVRKPVLPQLDVSGIEKSSFRELMDKKSEGIRKGLAGMGLGKKKKKNPEPPEPRPQTSTTIRPTYPEHESPPEYAPGPSRQRTSHQREGSEDSRPGPPQGKLPPVPPPPQLKRWAGASRAPHPWNKLRKDPELWDPHGDTLIFLSHESHQAARPPPSFRVSSHVLEATESKFFMRMLREGYTDFYSDSEMPPSPISSAGGWSRPVQRPYRNHPTTPRSDNGSQDPDGQISYELFFPAPAGQSKADSLRYHATTRNVFALLYQVSLVGLNLQQALNDLYERLTLYMPPDADSSDLVIDYVTTKRIDDARNDPATAISLLAWSEGKSIRWQEGWQEFFVHCVGMHHRVQETLELRLITPITKALLERAALEVEVRVQAVADRLADFNFDDMWPAMQPQQPAERACFERLRQFLKGYYESSYGIWPPPAKGADECWLSRNVIRDLQDDFGALYDYLVNRDVIWEGSEERSTRKWMIASTNPDKTVQADTTDLPLTDILVAFDNRHRYPHIPRPYPLVPDSMPPASKEMLYKSSKKSSKQTPAEDKMAERRIALAYTEATNIYILGPDFVSNKLADAYVRFEKGDKPSEVDPLAARRGRWVLLYGILQVLASVSVDTPGLRYKQDVGYQLNARLRGTPPWKGSNQQADEATHDGSYCWLAPRAWAESSESDVPMLDSLSVSPLVSPKERHARLAGGSVRSSAANSAVGTESDTGSSRRSPKIGGGNVNGGGGHHGGHGNMKTTHRLVPRVLPTKEVDHLGGFGGGGGYGPGIEKVIDEWPIRDESRGLGVRGVGVGGGGGGPGGGGVGDHNGFSVGQTLMIKDFDDYNF